MHKPAERTQPTVSFAFVEREGTQSQPHVDILISFGMLSMLVQGVIWSAIYRRLFEGEPVLRGALKFANPAAPLAWSILVIAVSAKHHMASVSGYVLIETAFIAAHYTIVSPLIACVYRKRTL